MYDYINRTESKVVLEGEGKKVILVRGLGNAWQRLGELGLLVGEAREDFKNGREPWKENV